MSPSLLSAITLLLSATAALSDTFSFQPLNSTCSHNGTPPASNGTSFLSNLKSLLSNLTSLSLSSPSTYLSFGDPPNRAFGLYFCTGDLPQSDCRNCILTAASDISSLCGSNRTGAVWYDYCQLRYSDTQFFGAPDTEGFSRINPFVNLSDPSEAIGIVSRLAEEAPISRPLMFAYYASVDDSLYGLAQCSGDLNTTGCTMCLSIIIDRIQRCCERARGWRYMALSCWVRFEASPFLKNINVPTQIIEYDCVSSTFPNNSIALMNTTLNDLLSSLKSQGSTSGFFDTTIISGAIQIHGRVLCRGDVNSTSCSSCLGNSSRYILRNCPKSDGGIVWYERCQLSYWVEGFYGAVDGFERVFCNEKESTEEADRTVDAMMLRLVGEAAEKATKFAAGNVSISDSLARYGLVQCSRDLGREECRRCLMRGKANATLTCKQKKGWRYLSASCNLRYEDFPFYDAQMTPDQIQPNALVEKSKSPKVPIVAVVAAIIGVMLLGSLLSILYRIKLRGSMEKNLAYVQSEPLSEDLPSIDMVTLQGATNNFSNANKLGEGGFGPVYKGILADGKEVAVKRLAAASSQGTEEFKTEVRLIAKLQHRNLVRLVGCCIDGEEKLLVYEYLSNGSLDTFLFDDEKRTQLDWTARDRIILGIARGMVYLHEDSQLRVVHRDLKAGNILLDVDLNPKISDFGMARIFKNDQDEAHTRKIVGTLGYMSPEYAMDGRFSVKSDVFSFCVLLLEIITGQKNGRSFFKGNGRTLLDYVWQLWREGRGMDTVDPTLTASCPSEEATRGIHVGLLCVQDEADDRPEMSTVLQMLVSKGMVLPDPKHPPTYVRRAVVAASEGSLSNEENARGHSVNDMTLTAMEGR